MARCFINGSYVVESFAPADDARAADGQTVLDFWQAQVRARDICARKLREAAGIEEVAGPYTIKDAMNDYLTWLGEHKRAGSERDARYRAEAIIVPALGKIECASLTTRKIRDWHSGIAKASALLRSAAGQKQNVREHDSNDIDAVRKRKASANRCLAILRAALNHAWRDGRIADDSPWRKVKPFANADAARARYLTVDECRRLVNASDPDLRAMVQGALATGCRYGELAAANCADFDPATGQLHIRTSKTGKGRHVILNEEGRALFEKLTAGQPGDAPIFRKAGERWLRSHQGRPFAAAVARAKITPAASFHVLRHTYASLAIMAGAPPMVVAQNLGHADTRMVEKHYGHLAREFVIDTIRATAPTFGAAAAGNIERLEAGR